MGDTYLVLFREAPILLMGTTVRVHDVFVPGFRHKLGTFGYTLLYLTIEIDVADACPALRPRLKCVESTLSRDYVVPHK